MPARSGPIAAAGGPIAKSSFVSGPQAPSGGIANAGTPFAAISNAQTNASVEPQSYRVHAVVLMILAFVAAALATAGLGIALLAWSNWDEIVAGVGGASSSGAATEGDPEVLDAAPIITEKVRPRFTTKATDGDGAATDAVPAGPTTGPFTVSLDASEPYTTIVVRCASGFQARVTLRSGSATAKDVPLHEDCELQFTGPKTSQYRPVHGGTSMTCRFVSTTASCK